MQAMKTPDLNKENGKPVGIWIRVSTEDQAQGDSPQHHEARARHYAAAKGWTVKEVYDLAGVSGKSVMEHPETKRMLGDVQKGRITALVFSKLARLTRNARELMDFADIFRERNADLISLQENLDTSTPSGRLFFNMVSIMAQWEREEITDRVKASVAIRAKLGKPLGGKAPYGYVWQGNDMVPHSEEAPVRKLMYELFAEHRRKKAVARILNERGFRTRNGSKFSDTTITRLLQDPTAKGVRRSNYTRSNGEGKTWVLKPEHEWVFHEVPAIVSEELWDQCNALLEGRKGTRQKPGKRPVHLFAGIVVCECGQKMYVPSSTPKYVCAKCRNRIPIVDLEAIFLEELKNYLLSPEQIGEYLAAAHSTIDEKSHLLETLTKELEHVKAEADRVFRLYMDEKIDGDGFKQRNDPLSARRKQIEEEIPKAEAEVSLLKIDGLSSEYIRDEAADLYSSWPSMTTDEKRRIVELLAKRITISKDEIDISLCYLPSFRETTNRQHILMDLRRLPLQILTGKSLIQRLLRL
jgi:site-specific DNA recombinase